MIGISREGGRSAGAKGDYRIMAGHSFLVCSSVFRSNSRALSVSLRGFWGCGEGLERKIGVYPSSCVVREAGFNEGIWLVYRVVVAQTSG
jgi:hypothetical protein